LIFLLGDTAFGKNVYLKYIALGKANKELKNELDNKRLIKHSLTRKLGDALTTLTGIQLVADITATSPDHFLVFCYII
jgi:hypothetical protein